MVDVSDIRWGENPPPSRASRPDATGGVTPREVVVIAKMRPAEWGSFEAGIYAPRFAQRLRVKGGLDAVSRGGWVYFRYVAEDG